MRWSDEKPSLSISGSFIHKGLTNPVDVGFLNGAGPALVFQHATLAADGSNYADYSVCLALLITGSTDQSPALEPSVALTVGFLNNLLQLGPVYTLTGPLPTANRFGLVIIFGVNLTQNP